MAGNWQQQLDDAISRRFERMVALRQRLHRHPEPSGHEESTSLHLYQLLDDEGFRVRMGPDGRGVIADSTGDADQRIGRIALRGDIDALYIHDAKQVPYRSQRDGVMHACGHDGHTAIIYGAVTALRDLELQGDLPWPLATRAIFQPSEETVEGAKAMVQADALEGVRAILGCHVDPSRRLGAIGIRSGVFTANCDQVDVEIIGRGGHAARPHEASDPIAAAAQLINAFYLSIPRVTDSQDAVVITIGQLCGGDNANVIPESVMLRGTIRTLDEAVRDRTFAHIERLSAGVGQVTDTRISVRFGQSCRSIRNDSRLVDLTRHAAAEVVEPGCIEEIARPSMGSEDFAFYLEHVPGAMFRLGCASERIGGASLHSPFFDIDEECLRVGARILARVAVAWSAPESGYGGND